MAVGKTCEGIDSSRPSGTFMLITQRDRETEKYCESEVLCSLHNLFCVKDKHSGVVHRCALVREKSKHDD